MRSGIRWLAPVVLVLLAATATVMVVRSGDEPCPAVSADALRESVDAGVAWMERALQDDGSFWYEYHRVDDSFADDYHPVRHVGALMALYQVAAEGGPSADAALRTGEGGLEFVIDRLVEADDRTAWAPDGRPAVLGSAALAVVGLTHRRDATGDPSYDELLRRFGRFMLSLQRDDGAMWARADRVGLSAINVTSTFYTGEAFWAFGLLHDSFPGEGWDDAARAVGRYIATERDAEEEIENPPLADQWAAYGFSEMRGWGRPLEGAELAYVRSLVDRYHGRLDVEIGREAKRVGDGSSPPDESVVQARGAGFGTTVEALGALWELSRVDPGLADLERQLRDDLRCGAAILTARQVDSVRAQQWPRPDVVEGAWFDEDVSRVDDQQHAISGVLGAIPAVGS